LDGRAPYVLQTMKTPDLDDPFYASNRHGAALDRTKGPLLLRTGWYDRSTAQTLAAYARVRDHGIKVYLTVGSWTHTEACGMDQMSEVYDFLDEFVAGAKESSDRLPVRVFATGVDEWRSLPSWPPAATQNRVFYLHGDNKTLDAEAPGADSPSTRFVYDPYKPTPTMGGPLLTRGLELERR